VEPQADRRGPIRWPVNWIFPRSQQRILHGLMDIGQFVVHIIRVHIVHNIRVELLNLSSPDAFSEVKIMSKNG